MSQLGFYLHRILRRLKSLISVLDRFPENEEQFRINDYTQPVSK